MVHANLANEAIRALTYAEDIGRAEMMNHSVEEAVVSWTGVHLTGSRPLRTQLFTLLITEFVVLSSSLALTRIPAQRRIAPRATVLFDVLAEARRIRCNFLARLISELPPCIDDHDYIRTMVEDAVSIEIQFIDST